MLAYRVFPWDPGAADASVPGHPEYLHRPQGHGRLDNPGHYETWYLASEPSGAVGEVFGDLAEWGKSMFQFPAIPSAERALGHYEIDDGLSLLDLDDGHNLFLRGIRPTQVIERNRASTQAWALRIYNERNDRGDRPWAGVRWWSFHRPQWRIIGLWAATPIAVKVERLGVDHPVVRDAAKALCKRLIP